MCPSVLRRAISISPPPDRRDFRQTAFCGEGLSGTGPKAGGPSYLPRLSRPDRQTAKTDWSHKQGIQPTLTSETTHCVQTTLSLTGPTGEPNRLGTLPRAALLCMGPGMEAAKAQARAVRSMRSRPAGRSIRMHWPAALLLAAYSGGDRATPGTRSKQLLPSETDPLFR